MAAVIPIVPQKPTVAPPRLVPPYPGLRPFQPEDSEYFFGRGDSIREVVRRLRAERFVAVIGGSGSGKSSLVLAGAIPRLRGFGLDDTGDFWVPIISTPGTDPIDGETPVQRLAGKFCGQLRAPEGETSQQRLKACSDLLREPGGLGKLVDLYGSDVNDLDGVDPENLKVNYLFLMDQFEELFHRSNRGKQVADDCAHLVARIVEQSKPEHRHANVCIALTMRSEHLNDCPRYKDLPDAINRAFYLVGRLDAAQISQAIQQPALRYLRNCMAVERQARREVQVPGETYVETEWSNGVKFEPDLLQRIQRDASAVLGERDHADQLPLLQHLLFWIWDAACKRCAGAPVPDGLNIKDLDHAVNPLFAGDGVCIADDANVLKACIENHCERIYGLHEHTSNDWKLVFRSLAFKEPNTGAYTQHRASMKGLSKRLGLSQDNHYDALGVLLAPWLNPHGYLHWDTDSWTVKVAHETLIRRWDKFRTWIDEDDRQFQLYLRLREESRVWGEAGKEGKPTFVASGNTLLLYENMQLSSAISDRDRNSQLQRLLEMDRDGWKLARLPDNAKEFLDASLAHRDDLEKASLKDKAEREKAEKSAAVEKAKGKKNLVFGLIQLVFAIFLLFVGIALNEVSKKELALHRGYALAAETNANIRKQIGDYDQPQYAIRSNIQAAQFFDDGQALNTRIADVLNLIPIFSPFEGRLDSLRNAELLAELRVSSSLRNSLLNVPWVLSGNFETTPPESLVCNDSKLNGVNAKYFKLPKDPNGKISPEYGLVLADNPSWGFTIYPASTVKSDSGEQCSIGNPIFDVPNTSGIKGIAIDGAVQNLIVSFDTYTQYYVVIWDDLAAPRMEQRAVVNGRVALTGIGAVPSRRSEFSTEIKIDQKVVRLFDVRPGLAVETMVKDLPALKEVNMQDDKSICKAFVSARIKSENPDFYSYYGIEPDMGQNAIGENRAVCLVITETQGEKQKDFVGELFAFSSMDAAKDTVKRIPIMENILFGVTKPTEIYVNRTAGWLAFRAGASGELRAVLWSLAGLRRQACGVFKAEIANKYESSKVPELSRPYDLITHGVATTVKCEKLKDQMPSEKNGPTSSASAMPQTITPASAK